MENGRKTVEVEKKSPKEEAGTHITYFHNDKRLIFPLATPVTSRVLHVYCVGDWKSCKWGPPPNMDGTPSSEGSDSTTMAPRTFVAPTTPVVVSSSSSTAAKTPSATSFPANSVKEPASLTPSQPISSSAAVDSTKQSIVSNGPLHKPSDSPGRIGALQSSPSPSAENSVASKGQLCRPSDFADRNRAFSFSSPSATATLPDVVPTTKAASASHGFPKNVARPAHKAYSDSSLLHGKSTSESLRGGVGGDFEEVSKAELDDEFDVLDNEGPSAANGAIKEDGSLSAGWEDDE